MRCQGLDIVLLRDELELGEHHKCFKVDTSRPGNVRPGSQIMAWSHETGEKKTSDNARQHGEILLFDGWIVHRSQQQTDDDAERSNVRDLVGPITGPVDWQITLVEECARQTQNINWDVQLERFRGDHAEGTLLDDFHQGQDQTKKLNHGSEGDDAGKDTV